MAAAAIMAAVAIAGYMGYTAYEYATMTPQERLMLANIEALTSTAEPGGEGSFQVGTKVITTAIETSEPGWEWNASVGAWMFEGSITGGSPSTTTGSTVTVTISCCRSKGPDIVCYYEAC